MKILFIIGSLAGGGAERVITQLANNFITLGHTVKILTIYSDECVYEVSKQIDIVKIHLKSNKKGLRYIKRILSVRRFLKSENPDILISFLTEINNIAILSSIFTSIKVVISERNDPNEDPKDKFNRLLRRLLYRFSNGYVFQTQDAQNYFTKSIVDRSIVIPNPVSTNLPYYNYNGDIKRIISVGRLEQQKNHELLIDSFSIIANVYPDYNLVIFGEGSLKTQLTEKIFKLKLANKVKINKFSNDIFNEILKSTIFVLPSDYEGCMACISWQRGVTRVVRVATGARKQAQPVADIVSPVHLPGCRAKDSGRRAACALKLMPRLPHDPGPDFHRPLRACSHRPALADAASDRSRLCRDRTA